MKQGQIHQSIAKIPDLSRIVVILEWSWWGIYTVTKLYSTIIQHKMMKKIHIQERSKALPNELVGLYNVQNSKLINRNLSNSETSILIYVVKWYPYLLRMCSLCHFKHFLNTYRWLGLPILHKWQSNYELPVYKPSYSLRLKAPKLWPELLRICL